MTVEARIAPALLLLRVGVFVVMLMWTLDKFVNPRHTAKVFGFFYAIGGLGNGIIYGLGAAELVLILAFLLGFHKRFTYGAVLLFHGISTLASFRQYLAPWTNLLFFAAWPMLAACFTLYTLRDFDTLGVLDRVAAPGEKSRAPASVSGYR